MGCKWGQVLYCLEYEIAYGGGVITVIGEAAINHMALVYQVQSAYKVTTNFLFAPKKTISDTKLKMCYLKSAVSAFHNYLNPIFLCGILLQLLCQILYTLCDFV